MRSGTPLPGWPIQMGEIQGQPLVADINNDGELEVVAGGQVVEVQDVHQAEVYACMLGAHEHVGVVVDAVRELAKKP